MGLKKVQKKSQNSKNQGFPYYFCLLIEGFGSGSIPLTNGSGSRRPKNMWIQWIRIRNTDRNESTKGSDIEAKDRNETKMFWCVPEPKAKRFYLFQKFWNKTKTFWCVPTFFCKSKTFLFFPKILEQNQNFLMCSNFFFSKSKTLLFNSKMLRSERERFGSIMNFVSKRIYSIFLGTLVGKRKQTISKKRWFDFTNSGCRLLLCYCIESVRDCVPISQARHDQVRFSTGHPWGLIMMSIL